MKKDDLFDFGDELNDFEPDNNYNKEIEEANRNIDGKNYDSAKKIFNDILLKDYKFVKAYVGLLRISSKNFSSFSDEETKVLIKLIENLDHSQFKEDKKLSAFYKEYIQFSENAVKALKDELKNAKLKKEEAIKEGEEIKVHYTQLEQAEKKGIEDENRRIEEEKRKREEAEYIKKQKEEAERRAAAEAKAKAEEAARQKAAKQANDFTIEDGVLIKFKANYKDVVIPESVKTIGKNAFKDNSVIQSVKIESNHAISFEEACFENCVDLKTVTYAKKKGAKPIECEIHENAFKGCKNLTEMQLNVKSLGEACFKDCSSLKNIMMDTIYIPESCFENCVSLALTSNRVKSCDRNAFKNCSSLISIIIENCSVEENAFSGCDKLEYIFFKYNHKFLSGVCENAFDFSNKNTVRHIIFYDTIKKPLFGKFPKNFSKNWYKPGSELKIEYGHR